MKKTHKLLLPSILIFLFLLLYVAIEFAFDSARLTAIISNIIAIFAGVTFWIEYKRNQAVTKHNNLNREAQFVMELNNQFISNEKLMDVELELERFNYYYINNKLTEEYKKQFLKNFDISSRKRQDLICYLVHLEGIASLVNQKIINLDVITDLMAYRYFIAVNNPLVQEIELKKFKNYYKGCYELYNNWRNAWGEDKIPLKEFELVKENSNSEIIK